jgi:RNA polymerase sigma factor (sigma-70 family)
MEAKFSSWLFRIAYNMSISQQRKSKVKNLYLDDYTIETYSEDELIETLNQESVEEREKKLKSAIGKLVPEQQLLLELFYDKEMSIIDVAKITDLSESNVKVKIHRARKKLFNLIQISPNSIAKRA